MVKPSAKGEIRDDGEMIGAGVRADTRADSG
jgi:hypothetical protein